MEERLARIEAAIGEIADVVRALCDKQAAIDEEVDRLLSSKVYDRLDGIESEFGSMVGGLNDIIDGRRKREYTDGLRTKRPEFGRYEPIAKKFGMDVYDIAAENTFAMPDEERESALGAMLEELKQKFDDLVEAYEKHNTHEETEGAPEAMAEGDEKGIKVEVETGDGVDPRIKQIAKGFRGRAVN